jgi:hypothetical protein
MKNAMKNQRGFATLLTSLMILVLISLNVFIGAKGSVIEQKSANNQYRTEEAFQNAEAGVAKMIKILIAAVAAAPQAVPLNAIVTSPDGKYTATYNATSTTITSIGNASGDATRTVTQRMKVVAGGAGGLAALNALGSVNLGGSTSATNVKAGGTVTGNATAGGNSSEFKVNLLDNNNNILMMGGVAVQRSMTTDEYFMYYFSGLCPIAKAAGNAAGCKEEARTKVAVGDGKYYYCGAIDCSSKTEDDKMSAAYTAGKRVFWLNSGGMDHKIDMGTAADPVLIFIMNIANGSSAAKINANSAIYGVVYIDIADQRTTTTCSCKASNTFTSTSPITPGWGSISYALNITTPAQPPACTVSACEAAAIKCTPANPSTATIVGTVSTCSYPATAVSGSNNTPVQIEVTGVWAAGGTGNSTIYGAAITSGNYDGTGNATYITNSTAVTNSVLGGLGAIGGAGFISAPVLITIDQRGWADVN